MKTSRTLRQNLLLGLLGLATIASFWIKLSKPSLSNLESNLFSAIEFSLALSFGWILQLVASREDYRESLKKFALSARRRINEISKITTRLIETIELFRVNYDSSNTHELDSLKLVAEGILDTAESSEADWAEILEEELIDKQELNEKVEEYVLAQISQMNAETDSKVIEEINDLKNEIKILRRKVPIELQDTSQSRTLMEYKASRELYDNSWIQVTSATLLSSKNTISGVLISRHFLGLALSRFSTNCVS